MIKMLNIVGIEQDFLTLIKDTYENPTANILNDERLKAFPLRSGTIDFYSILCWRF